MGTSHRNTKLMEEILQRIHNNTRKLSLSNKKDWYEVGKYLYYGGKIKMHNSNKMAARRTYELYSIFYGDWTGPSPRQLSKINKNKFRELVNERNQRLDINLGIEELDNLNF